MEVVVVEVVVGALEETAVEAEDDEMMPALLKMEMVEGARMMFIAARITKG